MRQAHRRRPTTARAHLAFSVLLGACVGPVPNDKPPGSPCVLDADCGGGSACEDGVCRARCTSDTSCPGADEVCLDGVCTPPEVTACDVAADCTSPEPCDDPSTAECTGGVCTFTGVPDGEPCSDGAGLCLDHACVECLAASDCSDPTGDPLCFDVACENNACVYSVDAARVCAAAACSDGSLSGERLCGAAGDCPASTPQSCGGFACADASLCRVDCSGGDHCQPDHYCGLPEGQCLPRLADGESCAGLSGEACVSGYCANGFCCAAGDCCAAPQDCPGAYTEAPSCNDPSSSTVCQGTRRAAACVDHTCDTEVLLDDSACQGFSRSCPDNLAPVTCTDAVEQPIATCPASCAAGPCAPGYSCESDQCVELTGLGNPCDGVAVLCDAGLKCENGVCCDADSLTCCHAGNEALVCGDGLGCDVHDAIPSYSCFTACTPFTSDACRSPGDYCASGGTACVPKLALAQACADGGQCTSGQCADGYCCNAACDGACESCLGSVTGLGNGACGEVTSGVDIGTCDTSGGCGATPCGCNAAGACALGSGNPCTQSSECASGNCECANGNCTERVCAPLPCAQCTFNGNGDGSCEGSRDGWTVCSTCGQAACACDGAGHCDQTNGASCTSASECASGLCECANADCTARVCSAGVCPTCKFSSGAACTGNRTSGLSCGASAECDTQGNCDSVGTCECGCGYEPDPGFCYADVIDFCLNGAQPDPSPTCIGGPTVCGQKTCTCECHM